MQDILLAVFQYDPSAGVEEFVLKPAAVEARQRRKKTANREREAPADYCPRAFLSPGSGSRSGAERGSRALLSGVVL